MNRLMFFRGMIVFALTMLCGVASSQGTPPPQGASPHKNELNLKGSLYFSHHDETDVKKIKICRYDLSNGTFSVNAEMILPTPMYFGPVNISPDGRFFSVTQTTRPFGSDANALLVFDVIKKTVRSYDTGGRIATGTAYGDGMAFVTINKYETKFWKSQFDDKPTTHTLPAFHSSLVSIDLSSGTVQEIRLPSTIDPTEGDYTIPHFAKGDKNKLYFYVFHASELDGFYSYNLTSHEYLRERRHIPDLSPDGRVIYFEVSDQFSPSKFEPNSKRLGWRLCTFKYKESATHYDVFRPIDCAEQIEVIRYYSSLSSYYSFLGTLLSGKYALIQETGLMGDRFYLYDIGKKKEINILDTNQSYVYAGIVE